MRRAVDHLLLAELDGLPVGSALAMLQSDGIALVWPPVVSCGATNPVIVEDLLMTELCGRMDDASIRLGQCLLAPDDEIERTTLERHGFHRATDGRRFRRWDRRAGLPAARHGARSPPEMARFSTFRCFAVFRTR